jgi:hypothetical protein
MAREALQRRHQKELKRRVVGHAYTTVHERAHFSTPNVNRLWLEIDRGCCAGANGPPQEDILIVGVILPCRMVE